MLKAIFNWFTGKPVPGTEAPAVQPEAVPYKVETPAPTAPVTTAAPVEPAKPTAKAPAKKPQAENKPAATKAPAKPRAPRKTVAK